jgi:hypothetical protein
MHNKDFDIAPETKSLFNPIRLKRLGSSRFLAVAGQARADASSVGAQ